MNIDEIDLESIKSKDIQVYGYSWGPGDTFDFNVKDDQKLYRLDRNKPTELKMLFEQKKAELDTWYSELSSVKRKKLTYEQHMKGKSTEILSVDMLINDDTSTEGSPEVHVIHIIIPKGEIKVIRVQMHTNNTEFGFGIVKSNLNNPDVDDFKTKLLNKDVNEDTFDTIATAIMNMYDIVHKKACESLGTS